MSKVITFSRSYPSYHPKKGKPTYFVEKLYHSLKIDANKHLDVPDFNLYEYLTNEKHTTIRKGKRFKAGDKFSPRIWGNDINPLSGRSGPYHSKQIILCDDVEIKKTWDIDIYPTYDVHINGKFYCSLYSEYFEKLANNDGLTMKDMIAWFSNLPFSGQIICWNDNVEY